jgi:hypothetical protein
MDNHADATEAAMRGGGGNQYWVPLDGEFGFVCDKVFLKLTAAP